MKKLLIIALFVLGTRTASGFAMTQEVVLNEIYAIIPLDNAKDELEDGTPRPTRFHATIDGHQLLIDSDTHEPIYIEVVSKKSGEVVAAGEFVGSTAIHVSRSGAYTLQLYSGNSVFAGEFVVE